MLILIDTGIWLRAFDKLAAERPVVLAAFRKLKAQRHRLVTSVQNISEFWNVSTRPIATRSGYGLTASVADQRVQHIERLALIVPFSTAAYRKWRELAVLHSVIGIAVHDARLVATMLCRGIRDILTFNVRDFRRYGGIRAFTPDQWLALP